jgi:hypothetical protein
VAAGEGLAAAPKENIMRANDRRRRWYARFVYRLAAALVLLGLCSSFGCEDKPTTPTPPAKPDLNRRMPK